MFERFGFVAVALGLLAALSSPSDAANYPSRTIRIVVPFTPGGATDVTARLLAVHLAERLGQSVIVENRPGAGGAVGGSAVAASPPDGHTLLFGGAGTFVVNPLILRQRDEATKPLTPIALVTNSPNVLVVHPKIPARTVGELVAYAKANPGKLNFASAGTGTPSHLTSEMLRLRAGIDIVHVPYKGGGASINDVVAGQVDMTFQILGAVLALVRDGKLRALAVTSAERIDELPDVQTMIESGLAGFLSNGWTALAGPPGMAPELVARLSAEVNIVIASLEFTEAVTELGAKPLGGSPEDFSKLLADEVQRWGDVVKRAGIKPD